jgi:HEPN domain-containing protein
MSSPKEPSPAMEYFKEALAYQISADKLLGLIAPQPRIGLPLSDPIYFLYHHAAELALQACLLAHNLPERKGHSIGALFEQCRKKHLLGTVDEHREMHNLMVFLDGKDYGKGYRYARQNDFVPELAWVQEGVRQLIADVEPHLKAWGKNNGVTGPWDPHTVTRLRYALGKPTYTKQPKPLKAGP